MPSLKDVQTTNAQFSPTYRPVAMFVGGTSGIGQAMAEKFAHHTKGNAHIIICGRNKTAAENIIATFPRHTNSLFEFVECDATFMKNVVSSAAEVRNKTSTLNYLVLSQGILVMQGRTETTEGFDVKMALHFYSRWKFVDELLPLLQKARENNEEARVMSVLAPGNGGKVNVDDLGLKKTFGNLTAGLQVPTYNDLFVEEYSRRYPALSFSHIYPGFVATLGVTHGHWLKTLFSPIVHLAAVTPDKCAEWMIGALWSPAYAQGGHHVDNHGEPVPASKIYTSDQAREKLAAHYAAEVTAKY